MLDVVVNVICVVSGPTVYELVHGYKGDCAPLSVMVKNVIVMIVKSFHLFAFQACGGQLPYRPSQFRRYVASMSVATCDDSGGQARATVAVCCRNVRGPPPKVPAKGRE
jgi:hypothetical protein